ncbi:amidohydrolase [Alpinimonas psychrophila]|uniref:Amidohydrolase 3 domain-containing protein n=1 Tax=Alpinimonas psychrophila TaxID=748908 RepID=A0A7W3PPR1_9MICO|nr:amidohydrolase [Alpinimonas psychrophila]MBA8829561.1 hypothetical protein [Alpinimonas psychrophila]
MRKLSTFERPFSDYHLEIVSARSIYTVDANDTVVTAILIAAGQIVASGTISECRTAASKLSTQSPTETDFGHNIIVPGFIDAHAHPLMLGQMMSWVDCGPDKAKNIPEIISLLKAAAVSVPDGHPIRGYGYEQRNLDEKRHPHKSELDEVASNREVYLMNASGHGGVVNSYTFDLYGVTKETPNPQSGEFFRDNQGELTGELSDAACNILTGLNGVKIGHHGPNFHLSDAPAEHVRQLAVAQENFLAGGVTAIGDAQVSKREFDTYLRLAEQKGLKTRVSMYLLSHLLDDAIDSGMHGAFGNSFLSFAGIKFYADGTLGGWTAYFPDGYLGDPCRTGQLYHEPEEYKRLISRAHAVGLQTATHAQSPTAIEMVIVAIEDALAESPSTDSRHRIEHCGLPTPEQIARMAKAGIRPVSQPQHHYNWGEGVEQAIGTPGERFNPLGEFARGGVSITISSDAPVANPRPLEAIRAAISRITRRGSQLGEETLAISRVQALRAHTINAAFTLGRESDLGSLEIGKRADFAVLDADLFEIDLEEIAHIKVVQTWVDGCSRYSSE